MAVTNAELLKLGLRIRAFRKVLGRNQKDFSKQCGLDRSYFGGVERGERNLSFFILCQICRSELRHRSCHERDSSPRAVPK
jgi:transcriptional regulator with XRE-family HTH domain